MVKKIKTWEMLFGIVLICIIYIGVCPEKVVVFASVKDCHTDQSNIVGEIRLKGRLSFIFSRVPNYVVQDGVLHLKVRTVTVIPFLSAVLGKKEEAWTNARLQEFASNHTELSYLWPAPSLPNFGVQWINASGVTPPQPGTSRTINHEKSM